MLTVGAELSTVIVTGAEVVRLPAASRATAVRTYCPSATLFVSPLTLYGLVTSSAPTFELWSTPATVSPGAYWNCTPATPTLSVAVACTVMVPDTNDPGAGDVMLTVGGLVRS